MRPQEEKGQITQVAPETDEEPRMQGQREVWRSEQVLRDGLLTPVGWYESCWLT